MGEKPIIDKRFNENIDIDKRVKEGSILARIYIEVQGNDKEAAKKALESTIFGNLLEEKYIDLLRVRFFDIRKDKTGDFFSGIAEIKLLSRDFRWFVSIVMRYGPSAIEIIKPHNVNLSLDEMHSILADVSEISQSYASQIMALLKDDERRMLYQRIIGKANKNLI